MNILVSNKFKTNKITSYIFFMILIAKIVSREDCESATKFSLVGIVSYVA